MKVDAGPFELGPVGGSGPAVLCLHGLSGTPYEVRRPAEALAAAGFACLGPLLPGHGETPEVLRTTPRVRWVEAANAGYQRLRETHERVYVLGLSMGGVLALQVAARQAVEGALIMAAPLDLGRAVRMAVPALARLIAFLPSRSNIRDPVALARHPSYDRMPLDAVRQLIRLGTEVEVELGSIEAPLRLIFSRRDRTVPISNAGRILEGVGSVHREVVYLDESGHVLPVDLERDRVEKLTVEFFEELEENAGH